jgi:2-(1,2-epoxy-1,2-dihydrophenyl)acetyl-CoA isomerase
VLLLDIVFTSPGTTFVTAHTAVPRAIGTSRALDLTLFPRRVSAEEAQGLGLVGRIVDEDVLVTDATAAAEQSVAGPAQALGQARRLIRSARSTGSTHTSNSRRPPSAGWRPPRSQAD